MINIVGRRLTLINAEKDYIKTKGWPNHISYRQTDGVLLICDG